MLGWKKLKMAFKKNRSQAGIEFLVITGFVIFFFTLFLSAIQTNYLEKMQEEEMVFMENLALSIKDEIDIARKTSEGYERTFSIPQNILGREYELEIIDNSIYLKTNQHALSTEIGNVEGELKKGENIIKKQDGEVYLN